MWPGQRHAEGAIAAHAWPAPLLEHVAFQRPNHARAMLHDLPDDRQVAQQLRLSSLGIVASFYASCQAHRLEPARPPTKRVFFFRCHQRPASLRQHPKHSKGPLKTLAGHDFRCPPLRSLGALKALNWSQQLRPRARLSTRPSPGLPSWRPGAKTQPFHPERREDHRGHLPLLTPST